MQDPNWRNRVEVCIPLSAAESFLETVLDQAQQILLRYIRPLAGGTLEVRKIDSYKEGDIDRRVILEALEQVRALITFIQFVVYIVRQHSVNFSKITLIVHE